MIGVVSNCEQRIKKKAELSAFLMLVNDAVMHRCGCVYDVPTPCRRHIRNNAIFRAVDALFMERLIQAVCLASESSVIVKTRTGIAIALADDAAADVLVYSLCIDCVKACVLCERIALRLMMEGNKNELMGLVHFDCVVEHFELSVSVEVV